MNRMSSSFGEGVGVNSEGVSVVPAIALPGEIRGGGGEGRGRGEGERGGGILMRSKEILRNHRFS